MSSGSHGEIVTLDVVYLTTSDSIRNGWVSVYILPEKGKKY